MFHFQSKKTLNPHPHPFFLTCGETLYILIPSPSPVGKPSTSSSILLHLLTGVSIPHTNPLIGMAGSGHNDYPVHWTLWVTCHNVTGKVSVCHRPAEKRGHRDTFSNTQYNVDTRKQADCESLLRSLQGHLEVNKEVKQNVRSLCPEWDAFCNLWHRDSDLPLLSTAMLGSLSKNHITVGYFRWKTINRLLNAT